MLGTWILGASLSFASASPPTDAPMGPRVAVQRVDSEALSPEDRAVLDARIRRILVSGGASLASAEAVDEIGRCGDAVCRVRTLETLGVAYWLSAEISGADRIYDVRLQLWSDDAEAPIATVDERCVVCGRADLENLVAAATNKLRTWIVVTADRPDLPVLAVAAEPKNARVRVDGQPMPPGFSGGPVWPGEHVVEVTAPGYEAQRQTVQVDAGKDARLHVQLRERPRHAPWLRRLGIAGLAVGVPATAAGITLLSLHGRDIGRRCGSDNPDNVDADGDCRYVHDTAAGGGVATGLGVALSAAGAALLILDRRRRVGRRAEVGPWVGRRFTVGVEGRF
jgi:hypothetical protein